MPAGEFVDESDIPRFPDSKSQGEKFPRIIIDGVKLIYKPAEEWYFYADDPTVKAYWFEGAGDENGDGPKDDGPPPRVLLPKDMPPLAE